jgi:radical SAM-linked protein
MSQRVRIRFSKQGDLRMIGHRDLLRTLERLFRRAQLHLAMSQGFHPRPRMSFPSALGVGVAALDEIMELELDHPYNADEVLGRLHANTVPGLQFQSVEILTPDERKAQLTSTAYEFPVPEDRQAETARSIESFLAKREHLVQRANRVAPVDIRPGVERLELCGGTLHMTLGATREASVRPRDVLAVLGLADLEQQGCYLTRTAVQLVNQPRKKLNEK